eukprot:XP_001700619.1 predicted protein [Chlamydomonas reinhardtii]
MLRTHAQLPSPFMMRERSLSIQSGWSAPTACDPSAAEVAEMLFSLRSGKRSAAELEEEVPAQPEERSSSSTGSACTATAAPAPKPLSKALTATSTRSYVWRGPKKCRTREVLFLGRQQEGGRGWVFFLNPALVWDDVSPETKMRLRTLPQETELAFARKYPSKPPRDWVKKSQKYRAPGGAVTHAVPLADMIYSLTAIYYKFEGRPGAVAVTD